MWTVMSEQAIQWNFEILKPGCMERNPVSEEFFTNDTRLEAVIRESIQNSIDANDATPLVRVRIYFSGLEDALPAADYARYRGAEADARYADPGSGLLRPIPTADEPCPYVVIEDFSTVGLTGDVDEKPTTPQSGATRKDWNYYNYFFRENGTSKGAEGTLGSWGAGKCVFQRASRLKTSFALSVRDGYEPRKFLVGKATLQIHRDDQLRTWAPDGWFGTVDAYDESRPNRIVKRPITDAAFIEQFAADFNLSRRDEPGTSIVIPYVHLASGDENASAAFNKTNLVRSVLRNFLISIQKGELEVEIQVGKNGEKIVIDKWSFKESAAFLPDVGSKDAVVTRLHHQLVSDALGGELPSERVFTLAPPPNNYPKWDAAMFSADQLKALKKCLQQKKPVLIDVPMPVLKKAEGKVQTLSGLFQVALMKADLPQAMPPVFYRIGLLVYGVQPTVHSNYVAAVVIDRNPVADMLVAAEPPSHSEWHRDVDRLKANYDKPWPHLLFVTYAVRNILDRVASIDKEPNFDPLSDVFGIPRKKSEHDRDDGRARDDDSDKPGDENDADEANPPRKERIVSIDEKSEGGLKGFRLTAGPGLANAKKFPFTMKMKVGYDTYHGLDWSKFDFDLGKDGKIKISVVSGAGVVAYAAKDNAIELTVVRPEPFEVTVLGFDPNRDVVVDKVRYDYGKEDE
ncbi:MAG: hypothetical protein Q4G65_16905 [bacterium]|nr:hypothetical protein [bacterium]